MITDSKRVETAIQGLIALYILHPEELSVSLSVAHMSGVLQIIPSTGDVGRIIGSRGNRFRALADIVSLMGERMGVSLRTLRIPEPDKPKPHAPMSFAPKTKDEYPRALILMTLHEVLTLCVTGGQAYVTTKDTDSLTIFQLWVGPFTNPREQGVLIRSLSVLMEAAGLKAGRAFAVEVIPEFPEDLVDTTFRMPPKRKRGK